MNILHSLPALTATAVAALALPAGASADVYVVRPRPIVVAPPVPPGAYVAPGPAYVAPGPVYAAPVCTTRTVRVWVNGVYTYRAVRHCY